MQRGGNGDRGTHRIPSNIRAAVGHLEQPLALALFQPLKVARPPAEKLNNMLDALDAFYERGKLACLLERLTASVNRKASRDRSRVPSRAGSTPSRPCAARPGCPASSCDSVPRIS